TIEPLVAQHRGRVVKLMGDGFLVEFQSVVDAVVCALEWQRSVGAGGPEGPPQFRIGVNLGDVIVEEGDIYGDGVNVAARLQAIADPGGICLSGTVYEHVGQRVDIAVEDRGEQKLKNIARPVRVYAVQPNRSSKAAGPSHASVSPIADKPSIAVLPFAD